MSSDLRSIDGTDDENSDSDPLHEPAATERLRRHTRRQVLAALAAVGIGSQVFRRALAAQAEQANGVTPEMIQQAEWIAGLKLSEEDRTTTAKSVQEHLAKFNALRKSNVAYSDPPALWFNPTPGKLNDGEVRRGAKLIDAEKPTQRPESKDELAFLSVAELARLLRSRQISSLELTKIYLERLHKYDEKLACVVTFLDEIALRQAERADKELANGIDRGPLHGIPWGAKDLIALPGYKTTWGAVPFQDQVLDITATVAKRLEEAGAVLLAKLTLGALAWGDKWFGGMTRNPWRPEQGSSGSSAGSASATSAGLVGFSLGSETLGSIVSPCRRCRTAGLRPTFGRVSRYGCMTLAWSMDKIGPICRTVEDCALVFDAIHGADGLDPTAVDRPFVWPERRALDSFKVGYVPQEKTPDNERPELERLTKLGVTLIPIQLPDELPIDALDTILVAEASAVFDDLTRNGKLDGTGNWPNTFRLGQFIPAIEYLRANRIRGLLMRKMEQVMADIDAYIGVDDLLITNLTGHPTVVVANEVQTRDGIEMPSMITITGRLYGESELLRLAHAFEQAGSAYRCHPKV